MNIQIDTSQLERDISTLNNTLENLSSATKNMYSCLNELNGMWDGAANATFMMQTQMDRMLLIGLRGNLRNLVECMEYAKSQYIRCNGDVNDKIASIRLSGDT